MALTITLPYEVETELLLKAKERQVSAEEMAIELLKRILGTEQSSPSPEEVVAKIQSTSPDPHNIRPATGSLADALRAASSDPEFDLEAWQQEWERVESEMRDITRSNALAERHG